MSKEETFRQWLKKNLGYRGEVWSVMKGLITELYPAYGLILIFTSFFIWMYINVHTIIITVTGIILQIICGCLLYFHGIYREEKDIEKEEMMKRRWRDRGG